MNVGASKQKKENELRQIAWLEAIMRKRDREAMESLYLHYRSRLGGFLRRLTHSQSLIDEIYNDVMMVVWRKADTFDYSSKVSTWLFAIAYRTGLKHLGKENQQQRKINELKSEMNSEPLVSKTNGREQQELINKALNVLSFEHRTAIELAYFSGESYADIAQITDASVNTVKTRIFYARKRLLQELKNMGISSMPATQDLQ